MTEPRIDRLEEFRPPTRFKLIPFDSIRPVTGRDYLVQGIVPREGLVLFWGPPKCGKTFLVLDIAMHIALGWEYRGRRVEPGAVVYVACEGERGIAARIEAFRREKMTEEISAPPFYLLPSRLDLAADHEGLAADIRSQLGGTNCAAIVIDTLNRSIGGSESSDQDMGAYIKAADFLREEFGCAVILIHHCGTDGSRPRGHTSLTGAIDAQLAVKRDAGGRIVLKLEYMKDGPEGAELFSTLEAVDIGDDQDGERITSCIVRESDLPAGMSKPGASKLGGATKVHYDMLVKALNKAGERAPESDHIPAGVQVVEVKFWREYAYQGSISNSDKPDAKRRAFSRASETLQEKGLIGIWDDLVWLMK